MSGRGAAAGGGARAHRCPSCKAQVAAATPRPSWFPFCGERCQLVDLGRWLDEDYRVSEPADQAGGGAEAVTDRDRE